MTFSTAFTARLTGASGRRVRYRVTIEGISGDITSTMDGATGLFDGRGSIRKIEESATTLDIYKMRQTGGGLLVSLQDNTAKDFQRAFSPRVRAVSFVTGATTATATSINMNTIALPTTSGTVYIGGETITYTGKATSPSRITGCTRGAFGSTATAHLGGTERGAGVYLSPPSWYGRRVSIEITLDGQDGTPDRTELIGTYRLEEAPAYVGDGQWELRCSHLSDELAKRKLGTGLEEVNCDGSTVETVTVSGGRLIRIYVPDGVGKNFTRSIHWQSHIMVQWGGLVDVRQIYELHSVDLTVSPNIINLHPTPLASSSFDAVRLIQNIAPFQDRIDGTLEVEWMKHVALLQGFAPHVMVQVALESKLGDLANGPSDILPGVAPAEFGDSGFQMGAGMKAAEIDSASLQAVASLIPQAWSFPIDDEIPATDIVESFCRQTGTAAVFSRDGKLTFRILKGERRDVAGILSQPGAVMGSVSCRIEEQHTFARARVECNYDVIDGEFEGVVNVFDQEIANTYPNAEATLAITDRSIVVSPVDRFGIGSLVRPSQTVQDLLPYLRRSMLSSRGGALVVSCRVDASLLGLELGDLVELNLPDVPDFRGGNLGDGRGRVIGRKPEWDGAQALTSQIDVLIEDRLAHFAAVVHIGAVVDEGGGTFLLTLSSITYAGQTTNPGEGLLRANALRERDVLNRYRPSDGTISTAACVLMEIVSNTQIRIATATAPSVGDVMIPVSSLANVSADGFFFSDYAISSQSRWR